MKSTKRKSKYVQRNSGQWGKYTSRDYTSKMTRFLNAENEIVEFEADRLGISVAEFIRRSVRIALPIMRANEALGVKP